MLRLLFSKPTAGFFLNDSVDLMKMIQIPPSPCKSSEVFSPGSASYSKPVGPGRLSEGSEGFPNSLRPSSEDESDSGYAHDLENTASKNTGSSVLEDSLMKLSLEKQLIKDDVEKMQWEVLEAKIGRIAAQVNIMEGSNKDLESYVDTDRMRNNAKYKRSSIFMLMLLMVSVLVSGASATTYMVGGVRGWEVGVNMTEWADSETFRLHDTLVFKYKNVDNNRVFEVSSSDFSICTRDQPIATIYSGIAVPLSHMGARYFVSNHHCHDGLKVRIEVGKRGASVAAWERVTSVAARERAAPAAAVDDQTHVGLEIESRVHLSIYVSFWAIVIFCLIGLGVFITLFICFRITVLFIPRGMR